MIFSICCKQKTKYTTYCNVLEWERFFSMPGAQPGTTSVIIQGVGYLKKKKKSQPHVLRDLVYWAVFHFLLQWINPGNLERQGERNEESEIGGMLKKTVCFKALATISQQTNNLVETKICNRFCCRCSYVPIVCAND